MGITGKNRRNRRRKSKKRLAVQNCFDLNRPQMEDLIVNAKEHEILNKFSVYLEKRFNVQIVMPKAKSLDSDIIFVTIEGDAISRDYVKTFLAEKVKEFTREESSAEDDIDLITLSDSESDNESDDVCVIDLDTEDVKSHQNLKTVTTESLDDSVCVVDNATNSSSLEKFDCSKQPKRKKRKAEDMKARSQGVSSSQAYAALCEVSSTTDGSVVTKKAKLSDSVIIIEEPGSSSKHTVDFIPLISGNKSMNQENKPSNKNSSSKSKNSNEIKNDDSVIVVDEPQPTVAPRRLRPIVIDGSNVAREHGRTSRTFSVKGLQLVIDYFLNRGHTQVTAFVPKFRRSQNPNRTVPTTDGDLLDELERQQHVVFTPSRTINDRHINSYDDRFIVQLAASNGGVIVSNDNYRDLLSESESFKEAIEQRLLMFCFVGDVFMIPDDPLGKNGPNLNDYLSFPPEDQTKTE